MCFDAKPVYDACSSSGARRWKIFNVSRIFRTSVIQIRRSVSFDSTTGKWRSPFFFFFLNYSAVISNHLTIWNKIILYVSCDNNFSLYLVFISSNNFSNDVQFHYMNFTLCRDYFAYFILNERLFAICLIWTEDEVTLQIKTNELFFKWKWFVISNCYLSSSLKWSFLNSELEDVE